MGKNVVMGISEGPEAATDAEARIAQLEARIGLLEKAVRSYGIPIPSTYDGAPTETLASPAVRALAQQDRKLEAIKLLVSETGMGLKEAKDIVDQLR